jgi:molybdopterin-guanine dinucleotide biosynthesis protein A
VPGALPAFDAVILAGGHGSRLGGADKPGLVVGSATMAATVTSAVAAAGARQVILVGPERPEITGTRPGRVVAVREDPPGTGPVPALRAGLTLVRAPWVAVLAADLPFLRGEQVAALVAAASGIQDADGAGAVVVDAAGMEQWLAGCWHAGQLKDAVAAYAGGSLRGLLRPLRPVAVQEPGRDGAPSPWLDCDTPAELAAAQAWLAGRMAPGPGAVRRTESEAER